MSWKESLLCWWRLLSLATLRFSLSIFLSKWVFACVSVCTGLASCHHYVLSHPSLSLFLAHSPSSLQAFSTAENVLISHMTTCQICWHKSSPLSLCWHKTLLGGSAQVLVLWKNLFCTYCFSYCTGVIKTALTHLWTGHLRGTSDALWGASAFGGDLFFCVP